jgi:hypothetical protein
MNPPSRLGPSVLTWTDIDLVVLLALGELGDGPKEYDLIIVDLGDLSYDHALLLRRQLYGSGKGENYDFVSPELNIQATVERAARDNGSSRKSDRGIEGTSHSRRILCERSCQAQDRVTASSRRNLDPARAMPIRPISP